MFGFEIHHYHHFGSSLTEKLDRILSMLGTLEKKMALIDDLQKKADETLVVAKRNSDAEDAVIDLMRRQADQLKDLKAALDNAGTDQQKLQNLSITIDNLAKITEGNAEKMGAAVVFGTPAAPDKPADAPADTSNPAPSPTGLANPPQSESSTNPGT